ncbi:hypothetical protein ACS0TY_006451 [Phlomoides rotata]
MFLSILAHHTKNRCIKFQFKCSGQIVSKHFHVVLHCVLKMQSLFLVKPRPVNEDNTNARWQNFRMDQHGNPMGQDIDKKEYGALSDLLSKSGIGWNSITSMIEAEDEGVWDDCRRAGPHVKGIQFKTWSYYPQWIEIFGNDRATGENVVDPIDLVNDRNGMEQEGDTGEKNVPFTPEGMHDMEDNDICKPTESNVKTISKGKK